MRKRKLSSSQERAISILIVSAEARCYELLDYNTHLREMIGLTDGDNDYLLSPFTFKWLCTNELVKESGVSPSMYIRSYYPTQKLLDISSKNNIKPFE